MSGLAPRGVPGTSLRAWLLYPPSLRRMSRHPVLQELDLLDEEQWRSPDEIRQLHHSRLLATVCHAVTRVPYYRERLRHLQVEVKGLRLPAQLGLLPTLDRRALQDNRATLQAPPHEILGGVWNQTGGSTGEPVAFLQEEAYRTANLAAVIRHDRWAGWAFGTRTALLWGADGDLAASRPWRVRLETRFCRRQLEMNAFLMDAAQMERFTVRLKGFRPAVVRGYASALELYASFLESRGRPFPPPAGVISCAETLSGAARQRIERAFEAPVFDRYGSREFGLIASQCERGSYHLNTRGVYLEILDGDRPAAPGSAGRVVITGLACKAMPLIRYETGDVAEAVQPDGCACGRGLPIMGRVHGRVSDFVSTPDGRFVHGEFFSHLLYGRHSVRAFSVLQDADGRLTLEVVGEGEALAREVNEVLEAIRRHLGAEAVVEARRVDEIPVSASGKRCFVRSAASSGRWSLGGARPAEGLS